MHWTEIVTIIFIISFAALMIVRAIYRKKHGITECSCGNKGKALVDAYHKENGCCCNKK